MTAEENANFCPMAAIEQRQNDKIYKEIPKNKKKNTI